MIPFLRNLDSLVSLHCRLKRRRRISLDDRRIKFSDSPFLSVFALSNARTPRSTIRDGVMTDQPTEAIPISKPIILYSEFF